MKVISLDQNRVFFKLIDENIENLIMVKYSANFSGNCWKLVEGFQ